jgi:hypothetical protein
VKGVPYAFDSNRRHGFSDGQIVQAAMTFWRVRSFSGESLEEEAGRTVLDPM